MECLADKCTSWWWISQVRVFLQLNESAHILHHIDFRYGRKGKINFEFPKLQNQKQHDAAQWHFWQQTQLEKILSTGKQRSTPAISLLEIILIIAIVVYVRSLFPIGLRRTRVMRAPHRDCLYSCHHLDDHLCDLLIYMFVGGFQNVLDSGESFSILVADWLTDWLEWSDSSRRWRQLNTANCGQPDDSFTMSYRQKQLIKEFTPNLWV